MDVCAESHPDHQLGAELMFWSADWRCRFLGSSWRPCAIWSQHGTPDRQPRATLAATGCQTAQHDAAATPGLHNHQRTCGCNQGRNGQQPAAAAARRPSHDMQSRWRCPCPGEWESVARGRRLVTTGGCSCTLEGHTSHTSCTLRHTSWPPQQTARPPSSSKARLWWDRRSGMVRNKKVVADRVDAV